MDKHKKITAEELSEELLGTVTGGIDAFFAHYERSNPYPSDNNPWGIDNIDVHEQAALNTINTWQDQVRMYADGKGHRRYVQNHYIKYSLIEAGKRYKGVHFMKTREELTALKAEFDAMKRKLSELSEDELKLVVGGGPTSSERLAMSMWNQMVGLHDMPKKNPDEKYVMSGNDEKN